MRLERSGSWTLVLALALLLPAAALADKGGNPNGKPFIELEGQILEVEGEVASLQDQVDSLVGQVATIEDRVVANQQAIADLEATNLTLAALIAANADDISSLEVQIAELEAQNAELEALIAANSGDIEELQGQVAFNNNLISELQQALSDLGTDLQDQIDNNAALIGVLEGEIAAIEDLLATKQAIIDGTCPEGSAVREIFEDGGVACESVGATGIVVVDVTWSSYVAPGEFGKRYMHCAKGSIAVGAGYSMLPNGVFTFGPEPGRDFSWVMEYQNKDKSGTYVNYSVRCIQLEQ